MPKRRGAKLPAPEQNEFLHMDFEQISSISATDCTGLIPAAPGSDAERRAYKDLYEFDATSICNDPRQ